MLNRIVEFFKKKYSLPEESRNDIGRKNVNIVNIVISFFLMFGITLLVINIINKSQTPYFIPYYSTMSIVSLVVILLSKIFLKINKYSYYQLFTILVSLFFVGLLIFATLYSQSYVSALISIYITLIILVICLDVNPIVVLLYCIFIPLFLDFIASDKNIPINVLLNNHLFCMAVFLLSLYKRAAVKKREEQKIKIEIQRRQLEENNIELGNQKDSLILLKKNLEEYLHVQSKELHEQNEKIIRMQNNTIVSLSSLVENRDEDTGDHVLRTRDYVELISTKAQLSGKFPELTEEMKKLFIKAAPMHDIGKIVVPDAVLKKPGKLTPEEFEMIKLHTTKGGKIVEDVLGAAEDAKYVKVTKEIATSHHEKYNGSGYPYGLKGEDIPLSARIMALADVYDALVSPRCYKKQMPEEEAFKIISDSAGTHFDPVLAQLFVEAKDEVIAIHKKYKE